MVGESLGVLLQALAGRPLDRFDDLRVERAAALLQEAAVRDLVRERMLERVLDLGEESRLVQELGGLQPCQTLAQLALAQVSDGFKQVERHVLADDRGGLQQTLVLRVEAINAGGNDGLRGRRYLQGR